MSRQVICLALALLSSLLWTGQAPAQQGAFDLIPEDAAFGLVARSLAEVRDKGDKIIDDYKLKIEKESRPSTLFRLVLEFLEIKKGLDEKGSVAILFPNFKKMGIEKLDLHTLSYIHIALPIADLGQMATNFDLKASDLKPGTIRKVDKPAAIGSAFVMVKGKHLYLGFREKALKWVAQAKPVTKFLSKTQGVALARADLALLLGPEAWGALWKNMLTDLEKQMLREGDQEGNRHSRDFVKALGQVKFVVAGLRLDTPMRLDIVASFVKDENGAATKFLKALRAGPGSSDLVGLPKHAPILAYGAKGDGRSNVAMVRTLLNILFDKTSGIEKILPLGERKQLLEALAKMYTHLKGSRAAVYLTGDRATQVGELATVAILDIDDPDAFQSQWPKLVELANKAAPRAFEGTDRPVPKLTYKAGAETIDQLGVNVLSVEMPKMKAEDAQEMRRLFGPDWNKLRMVVRGKSVVLLFGSDKALLRETLRNLKTGARGLAEHKTVTAALARLAPERKLEVHLSLKHVLPFFGIKNLEMAKGKVDALTSFALTVGLDRVHLEVVAPASEIMPFARALGF